MPHFVKKVEPEQDLRRSGSEYLRQAEEALDQTGMPLHEVPDPVGVLFDELDGLAEKKHLEVPVGKQTSVFFSTVERREYALSSLFFVTQRLGGKLYIVRNSFLKVVRLRPDKLANSSTVRGLSKFSSINNIRFFFLSECIFRKKETRFPFSSDSMM